MSGSLCSVAAEPSSEVVAGFEVEGETEGAAGIGAWSPIAGFGESPSSAGGISMGIGDRGIGDWGTRGICGWSGGDDPDNGAD